MLMSNLDYSVQSHQRARCHLEMVNALHYDDLLCPTPGNTFFSHVPGLANPSIPDGDTFKLDPGRIGPKDKLCVQK